MDKIEKIRYWTEGSERDFQTMQNLFEKKDYHWSLFMGHLVLERILKACVIKALDEQPPYTHNLLLIADKAGLKLSEKQLDDLTVITSFNIEARYDDYKSEFFKKCTKEYTEKWISEIKEIRLWLIQILEA